MYVVCVCVCSVAVCVCVCVCSVYLTRACALLYGKKRIDVFDVMLCLVMVMPL